MSTFAFNTHAGSTPLLSGTALRTMLVLALHAGAVAWALQAPGVTARARLTAPVPMALVAVMLTAPAKPVATVPLPAPSKPQPSTAAVPARAQPTANPQPRQIPSPAVATPNSAVTAPASEQAPPASAAPVQAATPALAQHAAPAAMAAARFDADYLNNPAPAYPLLSRRQGESGKVLLLVQVTAQGTAAQVEIKQGCGFPRLDQAALNTVRNWRLVPARRGDEAVAASVVVPITFRLDS